jgi:hypothetical protein
LAALYLGLTPVLPEDRLAVRFCLKQTDSSKLEFKALKKYLLDIFLFHIRMFPEVKKKIIRWYSDSNTLYKLTSIKSKINT